MLIWKREPEEMLLHHGRNSQALYSYCFGFFSLPGLFLPRAQIHIKTATRGDINVEVVVDSVVVNFICQLDGPRAAQVFGQILF